MSQYEELLELAQAVSLAVERYNDDEVMDAAFEIAAWTRNNGFVSRWLVMREQNGIEQYVYEFCIRHDEDVESYVNRERHNWECDAEDELILYKDRDRALTNEDPEPALVVAPLVVHDTPRLRATGGIVDWLTEGF